MLPGRISRVVNPICLTNILLMLGRYQGRFLFFRTGSERSQFVCCIKAPFACDEVNDVQTGSNSTCGAPASSVASNRIKTLRPPSSNLTTRSSSAILFRRLAL